MTAPLSYVDVGSARLDLPLVCQQLGWLDGFENEKWIVLFD